MRFSRFLAAGALVSLALHGTGSAFFAQEPDEVSIAASEGGGVAVIGSIEDLVAGAKADVISETAPVERIEPDTEPLKPVETDTVSPVTPAQPIMEPVPAEAVSSSATVPFIEGVTGIEPVKAVDSSEPVRPVEPVKHAREQRPVEIARADTVQAAEPAISVTQDQEVLSPVEDALATVTQSPRTKPKPPLRKAEPKRIPDKTARTAQRKGAEASSRKGGERVTSKTALSNANGRANAKSKDGGTQAASNYKGKVVARLRRAKRFPPQARRKRLEGTAYVAFTISRNGSVSGIRLTRSSGHALLDRAALDMVRRASPMPEFPGDITVARMNLQVPVRFDR